MNIFENNDILKTKQIIQRLDYLPIPLFPVYKCLGILQSIFVSPSPALASFLLLFYIFLNILSIAQIDKIIYNTYSYAVSTFLFPLLLLLEISLNLLLLLERASLPYLSSISISPTLSSDDYYLFYFLRTFLAANFSALYSRNVVSIPFYAKSFFASSNFG